MSDAVEERGRRRTAGRDPPGPARPVDRAAHRPEEAGAQGADLVVAQRRPGCGDDVRGADGRDEAVDTPDRRASSARSGSARAGAEGSRGGERMTTGAVEQRDAPQPQPEHDEPRLRDPGPTQLTKRDYLAIGKRAGKKTLDDNLPALAAALAYYAFLAIPSILLVTVGTFSLLAGPDTVNSLMDTVGKVMPAQATDLLRQSLTNMTKNHATGITIIGIGGLIAIWSLGGAMQNV